MGLGILVYTLRLQPMGHYLPLDYFQVELRGILDEIGGFGEGCILRVQYQKPV